MTAGITDSVTVADSGNLGTGYEGWRAFDNNSDTRWGAGATSGILSVTLATAKVIAGYSIRARNDTYLIDSPKDWTLEGSNDGTSWTVLDTQTGITSWSMNERKEFTVASPASYLYYRLNISSNQSGTDTSVSEVELLEGVPYGFDFYASGNRVVGPISLSGTAYGDEILTWTLGDMPTGTSVAIGCALTTNETPPSSFSAATNGAQCPVISRNDDLTGKYLWIKQELATSNIEVTPSLCSMEMQLVLAASANLTIEIDRTTMFSGMNYRSNTVSALPCGALTTFEPYDVYDGFLYWRARAVNTTLGIDTGWSVPNTFNLMGGPFPLPRFFTLVENRQFNKQREQRALTVAENIGFGKPRGGRALYFPENWAFGRLKAARSLYTELSDRRSAVSENRLDLGDQRAGGIRADHTGQWIWIYAYRCGRRQYRPVLQKLRRLYLYQYHALQCARMVLDGDHVPASAFRSDGSDQGTTDGTFSSGQQFGWL